MPIFVEGWIQRVATLAREEHQVHLTLVRMRSLSFTRCLKDPGNEFF